MMRLLIKNIGILVFVGVILCSLVMPVRAAEKYMEKSIEETTEMEDMYLYRDVSSRFNRAPKNIYGKRKPFYKIKLKKRTSAGKTSGQSGKKGPKKKSNLKKNSAKRKSTVKKKTKKNRKQR